MSFVDSFKDTITKIDSDSFEEAALSVFDYQYHQNPVYQAYCKSLGKIPEKIQRILEIPFLPISFYKNHVIKSGTWSAHTIFMSSGTTGSQRSISQLRETEFYNQLAKWTFEKFFGPLKKIKLMALLPSYQEQQNSSLIHMVDHFIQMSKEGSGYYLEQSEKLSDDLQKAGSKLLIGVSFALLDFIEKNDVKVKSTTIMETGGMKGRRMEITRQELHNKLMDGFGVKNIASEYGMTELLSQAYATSEGIFQYPNWAKVLIRDINDPFEYMEKDQTGGINIIDLANIDTCSFIETMDLGRSINEQFQVLGRYDNSDIRGCNLMI